jgi:hypothetical protein
MDAFQSPRSMVNAVFADAMKEQQAVTAAAAAAVATATLQQEAANSSSTTTINNSTNLNTTDTTNPSKIATSNGTAKNASTDSSLTNNAEEDASNSLLPSAKRTKNNSSNSNNKTKVDEVDEFRAQMDSLWKNAETEAELEIAFKKTMDLANKQTELVIREGQVVYVSLESIALNILHRFSPSLYFRFFSDWMRFIA